MFLEDFTSAIMASYIMLQAPPPAPRPRFTYRPHKCRLAGLVRVCLIPHLVQQNYINRLLFIVEVKVFCKYYWGRLNIFPSWIIVSLSPSQNMSLVYLVVTPRCLILFHLVDCYFLNAKLGRKICISLKSRLSRNEMWYAADNHNYMCHILPGFVQKDFQIRTLIK